MDAWGFTYRSVAFVLVKQNRKAPTKLAVVVTIAVGWNDRFHFDQVCIGLFCKYLASPLFGLYDAANHALLEPVDIFLIHFPLFSLNTHQTALIIWSIFRHM